MQCSTFSTCAWRAQKTLFVLLMLIGLMATPFATSRTAQTASAASAITSVKVRSQSSAAQSNLPITFGQAFAPGDVPTGQSLAATLADGTPVPLQVDAKATHADGSLRHAVLSAQLPTLAANVTTTLLLMPIAAPSPGTAISASDVLATALDATIEITTASTRYTASARELLQANSSRTWLAGPIATEWVLTAPLKTSAGVAHPHLTARFNLRAYKGLQQARIDAVIENNWAYETAPQNFIYDVVVRVGGQAVYQQTALKHLRQARWRKTFWWGAAPQAHVAHDVAYLIKSRAVPSYDQSVAIPESALAALANDWAGSDTKPMGVGLVEPYMPTTGGRRDIGPLPGWSAQYLLSMDARAKIATLGSGDLAGSWGIHYRDKKTDLPASLIDFPYMSLLGGPGDMVNPKTGKSEAFPTCSGDCASPYSPDSSHQPSLAYLPYLVSGDFYLLDELQFWANWNMLQATPAYRGFEKGLLNWDQVRGQAWSMRSLAEAAYITPDAHPLKTYFVQRMANNIAAYRQSSSDNASANTYGFLDDGCCNFVYNNGRGIAPWQDDFFTWAMGYAVDLGFGDALPMLKWKSKFAVARMTAPGYCWISGSIYAMNLRDSAGTPLYADWAKIYEVNVDAAVRNTACGSAAMGTALGLQANEMVGYSSYEAGYPSNMQPALAVAAQSGIPNAAEAWVRFMSRSVKPSYAEGPSFAIVPRSAGPITPTVTPAVTPSVSPAATTKPNLTPRAYLPIVLRNATSSQTPTATATATVIATATVTATVRPNVTPTPTQTRTPTPIISQTPAPTTPPGTPDVRQNPTLAAIPANTALDLGKYECNQPNDQTDYTFFCKRITDYSGFVYDANRHKFLMFGGGHASTFRDDVDVFDFATLKWTSAYSSTPCSAMTLDNMDKNAIAWKSSGHPFARHTYDLMVVPTTTKQLLLLGNTNGRGDCTPSVDPTTGNDPFYLPHNITSYNPDTKTWTHNLLEARWNVFSASEFDPLSGQVLLLSQYGLWTYDPVTRVATQQLQQFSSAMQMGYANNLVYFPPNDKFYYIARESPTKVFELTLNRSNFASSTLTEVTGMTGTPNSDESGWNYDAVHRIIGGGVKDGKFYAYDPLSKQWTTRTMTVQSAQPGAVIGSQAYHALGYDPIDGVFVFMTDYESGFRVWAYRY